MDVRLVGPNFKTKCGPDVAYGADFVHFDEWPRWRYQIDIAGDTCGDGINRRLLTGSLVVHLQNARGYREFYQPLMFGAEPRMLVTVREVAEFPAAARWAMANDAEAGAMASRAEEFMRTYVYPLCSRQAYYEGMLDALAPRMKAAGSLVAYPDAFLVTLLDAGNHPSIHMQRVNA